MAYTRQYKETVGWENEPSVVSPINATNLGQVDEGLLAVDKAVYNEFASVNNELQDKQDKLTFDNTPRYGSSNPVTSNGIKNALDNIIYNIPFDGVPTEHSMNPVRSNGIYEAIQNASWAGNYVFSATSTDTAAGNDIHVGTLAKGQYIVNDTVVIVKIQNNRTFELQTSTTWCLSYNAGYVISEQILKSDGSNFDQNLKAGTILILQRNNYKWYIIASNMDFDDGKIFIGICNSASDSKTLVTNIDLGRETNAGDIFIVNVRNRNTIAEFLTVYNNGIAQTMMLPISLFDFAGYGGLCVFKSNGLYSTLSIVFRNIGEIEAGEGISIIYPNGIPRIENASMSYGETIKSNIIESEVKGSFTIDAIFDKDKNIYADYVLIYFQKGGTPAEQMGYGKYYEVTIKMGMEPMVGMVFFGSIPSHTWVLFRIHNAEIIGIFPKELPSVATRTKAGIMKPDGETTGVDADGTLHAATTISGNGGWRILQEKVTWLVTETSGKWEIDNGKATWTS